VVTVIQQQIGYHETFGEFKRACQSFFRKRKKYLPELQMLLSENFHIQAG